MKKLIAVIMILMLCFCVAACGAKQAEPAVDNTETAAPEPTPEPTPEPVKVITVAADSDLFLGGAEAVLAESGYELQKTAPADYTDADAAGVIAYLTQENADTAELAAAAARGAQVVIYDTTGTNKVDGALYFDYDASAELSMLFEQMYAYPLHDTPVRMIGLFTSTESEAYAVWTAACEAGMIFPKEVYIESEQTELDETEWLTEELGGYFPGMLDCIFAENEVLGASAGKLMESLGRDDAEVFYSGASEEQLELMRKNSRLYGMTVGQDVYQAGKDLAGVLTDALDGNTAEAQTFQPVVIFADSLAAAE